MKRSWIGGFLLLALGGSLGWSLRTLLVPPAAEGASDADESAPAEEVSPGDMEVRVTTAPAETGDLPCVVEAVGVVQAEPAAKRVLSSRAGGRVLEALARLGQTVKRGDVLLRFDPVPLQAALLQARAAQAAAANQLSEFEQSGRDRQSVELQTAARRASSQATLLDAQVARLEPLHGDGLVSDKVLAEARQAAEQGRADQAIAERAASAYQATGADLQHATLVAARDAAVAGAQEAEHVLADAEVRSPCDGQVVAFSARPGEKLEPGVELGQLLAAEGRVLVFGIAARSAHDLKVGARASWDDGQGLKRTGVLASLGGEVDAASGLIQAIVAPDPGVPPMPPGQSVRGEIEARLLSGAVIVPEKAVLRAKDAQVVVVADADHARIVPVQVAGRHAGLAAVLGEVRAGDRVVVDGGYNLPAGARLVESRAEPAPPGEVRK